VIPLQKQIKYLRKISL